MRRKTALAGVLVLALLLTGLSLAATDSFSLPWWTVDGGGGSAAGSGYQLSGTIGQFDAGVLSHPDSELAGGFWVGPGVRTIYLPVVVNDD